MSPSRSSSASPRCGSFPTGGSSRSPSTEPSGIGRLRNMSSTYVFPGAIAIEREHVVPLDHSAPDGEKITVFTREVAHPDGRDKPYLLFLEGGPGMEPRRPQSP